MKLPLQSYEVTLICHVLADVTIFGLQVPHYFFGILPMNILVEPQMLHQTVSFHSQRKQALSIHFQVLFLRHLSATRSVVNYSCSNIVYQLLYSGLKYFKTQLCDVQADCDRVTSDLLPKESQQRGMDNLLTRKRQGRAGMNT